MFCPTRLTSYQVKTCPWPDKWPAYWQKLFAGLIRLKSGLLKRILKSIDIAIINFKFYSIWERLAGFDCEAYTDISNGIIIHVLLTKTVTKFDVKPICSFQVNSKVIIKVLLVESDVFRVLINNRWWHLVDSISFLEYIIFRTENFFIR